MAPVSKSFSHNTSWIDVFFFLVMRKTTRIKFNSVSIPSIGRLKTMAEILNADEKGKITKIYVLELSRYQIDSSFHGILVDSYSRSGRVFPRWDIPCYTTLPVFCYVGS